MFNKDCFAVQAINWVLMPFKSKKNPTPKGIGFLLASPTGLLFAKATSISSCAAFGHARRSSNPTGSHPHERKIKKKEAEASFFYFASTTVHWLNIEGQPILKEINIKIV